MKTYQEAESKNNYSIACSLLRSMERLLSYLIRRPLELRSFITAFATAAPAQSDIG